LIKGGEQQRFRSRISRNASCAFRSKPARAIGLTEVQVRVDSPLGENQAQLPAAGAGADAAAIGGQAPGRRPR
jgi:hypothetical protein